MRRWPDDKWVNSRQVIAVSKCMTKDSQWLGLILRTLARSIGSGGQNVFSQKPAILVKIALRQILAIKR